ncbi:MAG: class I SAM-dependent methyltransferase [Candidatus Bathyarchaeota archaeon]|nr:class I SAM-dependent methyltransferase [Candidatus Bathyarchaeota archaeon]
MPSAAKKAFFEDYVFEVHPNVYEPAEDSFLFAENLPPTAGKRVLEVGAGCGILSVVAAKQAQQVVAVDINPYAIRCAKQNAHKNGVHNKVAFLQADLFTSLNKAAKFDLIFFNSPYVPSEQNEDASWLARAWAGGATGRQVIDRFISQVGGYVAVGGAVFLLQSNLAGVEQTLSQFALNGMCGEVVVSCGLPFFERLVLIRAAL